MLWAIVLKVSLQHVGSILIGPRIVALLGIAHPSESRHRAANLSTLLRGMVAESVDGQDRYGH